MDIATPNLTSSTCEIVPMRAVSWHSCLRKASWKSGVVTGIYRPPGIAVAIRSYYYSFATPSGKRDDVEKLLASLETSGIPVLRALVKGRNPADLSDAERRSFSFFVGMLDVRVPSFRHTIESFAARLIRDAILVEAQHPEYFERKMQEAHAAKDLIPPDDLE